MKLNKLLLTTLIPLGSTPVLTITSCNQTADFETDSWEHVISVTNKGFISFAKTYVEDKNMKVKMKLLQE